MKRFCLALGSALLFVGCVSAPFQPPSGAIAVAKAPLSTEGNWKAGMKCGVAASQSVLGLYAWGDCSITAAAKQGGHADGSVMIKNWVYSGVSADVVDMALNAAIA